MDRIVFLMFFHEALFHLHLKDTIYGHFVTACCLCADTAAAAVLSTELLTGYAPGLWTE